MWNWGEQVAEHAAAAAWTTWPVAVAPTVLDPPGWGDEQPEPVE